MDLSTTYLGFKLPHPFMPGASPLVDDLDTVRRLEDAGAAAIVMHSLFEEQIVGEYLAHSVYTAGPTESFPEALTYFPPVANFALGPDAYLEQLRRIKAAVDVPVLAIGGVTIDRLTAIAQTGAAGVAAISLFLSESPGRDGCRARPLQDAVKSARAAFDTPRSAS